MAAGLGSFDGDAADCFSAQPLFLQADNSACEKGLLWQQALGLFGSDVADCGSVQRYFLQAAIRTCEKGLPWQLALGLWVVMQKSAIMPDVNDYTAVQCL